MTGTMLSDSQRKFLGEACETYQQQLREHEGAKAYLKMRSLSGDSAAFFRLGVVESPLPGHEKYQGKLAIPYLTRSGVVDIRFRCLWTVDHPDSKKCVGHPKYLSLPGSKPRLYNPNALLTDGDCVGIAEGEPDAWIATQAGLPTVGIPGVTAWRGDFMPRMFAGYRAVYIFVDNDDSGEGQKFADKVADSVPNPRQLLMPAGHDVNSFVTEFGEAALRDKWEVKSAG